MCADSLSAGEALDGEAARVAAVATRAARATAALRSDLAVLGVYVDRLSAVLAAVRESASVFSEAAGGLEAVAGDWAVGIPCGPGGGRVVRVAAGLASIESRARGLAGAAEGSVAVVALAIDDVVGAFGRFSVSGS